MKKNYLWLTAMAAMLTFSACSEDASPLMDDGQIGEVVMDEGTTFELAISNTGVGSRAARPMGSSAAANNVNKVQLKFYKKNEKQQWEEATDIQAYKGGTKGSNETDQWKNNIVDFDNAESEYVPGDNYNNPHIEESKKIRLVGLAENTQYRIVAYGYNDKLANPNTGFAYGELKPAHDTENSLMGLLKTENQNLSGYDLEEVFAGTVEKTTNGSSKFEGMPRLTLTRQVAGILAYFKIPTKMANKEGVVKVVKTVEVIANDKSKDFQFPASFLGNNFNGIKDETANGKDVLIKFDMEKASINYNKNILQQKDEYYKTTDNVADYKPTSTTVGLAEGYTPANGLLLQANTFFGARYVLPYAGHVRSNTLKVEMYDVDGKKIKTLIVTSNNGKETKQYDILCNNFYSIGKKLQTDSTNPTPNPDPNPDPEPGPEPQPDPDKPIDLGTTDHIVVEINDAWEVLHNMDIEEEEETI